METVADLAKMYEKLGEFVFNAGGEVAKAGSGNKSAATRLRKAMMDVKKQAQAIRKASFKDAPKTPIGLNL